MKMKLADGRVFDTATKKLVEKDEPPQNDTAEASFIPIPVQTVRLEELPADIKQMNVICAIMGYRLIGCPDTDICHALGCTLEQLNSIISTDSYDKAYKMMIDAFVAGQTKAAKDIIMSNAANAANTLITVMQKGGMKEKLAAANSVLNRAGIGEEQSSNGMDGGLVIKIVRDASVDNINIKIGA